MYTCGVCDKSVCGYASVRLCVRVCGCVYVVCEKHQFFKLRDGEEETGKILSCKREEKRERGRKERRRETKKETKRERERDMC